MREAIGTTYILNIIIIFILVIFAAITGIISYSKAYKVSTRIGDAIERAEGYNDLSKTEINRVLGSLGYRKGTIDCPTREGVSGESDGLYQYCVYRNDSGAKDKKHYQYAVLTYMYFDLPLINEFKIPIYVKTDRIYCFSNTGCN
ncbi:MAG: hypothetical protein V8Q75_05085 [Bacilli bacterium]